MGNIILNRQSLPYPGEIEIVRKPNVVCENVTMTGATYADYNGWKYEDVTLEWDALYPEDLKRLVTAVTSDPYFMFAWDDIDGTRHNEGVYLKKFGGKRTLVQYGNSMVWKGVSVTLSFPAVFTY